MKETNLFKVIKIVSSRAGVKTQVWTSPGGLVVKNLPANAGNTDLILHTMQQLNPRATTTEHVPCNKRSHCNETPSHHN